MKPSNYCLWAVLCLAAFHQATATPQSEHQAAKLAAGWLAVTPNPLGAAPQQRLSAAPEQPITFRNSSGEAIYYVVSLDPEGFVITSTDSDLEPIIAFSSSGSFVPEPENPLYALLQRDMAERLKHAHAGEQSKTRTGNYGRNKWSRLADDGPVIMEGSGGFASVNDLRVAPFVQSRWGQGTVCGLSCFNFYTPPYEAGNAQNYVCGCVSTAAAQLMRYFQYPTQGVGTKEFDIAVGGVRTSRRLRGGDGVGGPYAWNLMPLVPDASTTELERSAIGALTADIGVAAGTSYGRNESGGWLTGETLKTVFGYSSVIRGSGMSLRFLDEAQPNLDARLPIYLEIRTDGGAGHAIICDGYGYNLGTLYHHLNLGWGGQCDAWYNLPNVDTGWYQFTSLVGMFYNIYTNGTGEIISGRVLDVSNIPIPDTLVQAEGGAQTYSTHGDGRGIYALPQLPSNTSFTLTVTKDGYQFAPRVVTTGCSQDYQNTGNRWAVDFTGIHAANGRIISGYITNSLGVGVAGVEVRFSDGGGTLVTDASGKFFNTVAVGWSGTVTPSKDQCQFLPSLRSYSNIITNLGNQDFLASVVIRVNAAATGANKGTSWRDAYTNLQTALAQASAGSELWVAEGVYHPANGRTNVFQFKAGVNLYGGFAGFETVRSRRDWIAHVTELSGDIGIPGDKSDNVYHVVAGAPQSLLDGCTVTGGNANGPTWDEQHGGGISCPFGVESFTVANCRITSNSAKAGGGVSQSTLNNCRLSGNSAEYGGGAYQGILNNCTLADNSATQGGGAYYATLNNCTITGNSAVEGGGARWGNLNHCILAGNSAVQGGGVAGNKGSQMHNCLLTGNSAEEGGGVYGWALKNCIVFNNSATKGANYYAGLDRWGRAVVTLWDHCCTTPLPSVGVGNIDSDPMFVDYPSGNLRLQANSPCINAGLNAYAPGLADLDGLPRIVSGTVDIGAYEFQGPGSVISYAWLQHYGLPTDGSADNTDPDADGHTTWQEWRCQTDPTNAFSALRLLSASPGGTNVTVSWQSVAGVNYCLERSTNLASSVVFTPLATGIPGQPGTTTFTDANAAPLAPLFYRVGVGP